jgi:hypothetical protein
VSNMAVKKEFPEWARILYRGLRSAVGAGIAQVVVLQPNWSNQEEVIRTVLVAFGAGFLPAFGMFLRDWLDKVFGLDEKSVVARTMPI